MCSLHDLLKIRPYLSVHVTGLELQLNDPVHGG